MEREIKFRCWDKQYKKMYPVTFLSFITDELDHAGNLGEPKSIEHFDLMQYTGMKDKQGTEIYEGDKVKFRNFYNGVDYVGVVIFDGAAFVIQCDKGGGAKYSPPINSKDIDVTRLEVINK